MHEINFTREQIIKLAGELERLKLPKEDQDLLVAIFSAARDGVVEDAAGGGGERPADDLRSRLINAFIPGQGAGFTITPRVGPGGQPGGH